MASEKNERLVNLLILLLSNKRFLTKEEIYKSVSGYEGNSEAKDRMFERDKEQLRALGIEIEMKNVDAFFEDVIGYRILPDRYRFNIKDFNTEELTLMALAAKAWQESALANLTRSTTVRLESLGIASDLSELPIESAVSVVPSNLTEVLEVLNNRKIIEFDYVNIDDQLERKQIKPLGVYSQQRRWYLYGRDLHVDGLRSYRIDRIEGDIKGTRQSFDPEKIELPREHFPSVKVEFEIRRDSALELLASSTIEEDRGDWLFCSREFSSQNVAIGEILRFSPDVKVIGPQDVVKNVQEALKRIVAAHA